MGRAAYAARAPVDTAAVRTILAPLEVPPLPDPALPRPSRPRRDPPLREPAVEPAPRRERTAPPAKPRVVTTRIGDSVLRLIQTEASYPALYRAEVDGQPRRLVVRRDGGSWVEGDEGEVQILVSLIDEGATRAESPGRLVLSRYTPDAIRRSWDMTDVTVHVDGSGKVVVDIVVSWEPGSYY